MPVHGLDRMSQPLRPFCHCLSCAFSLGPPLANLPELRWERVLWDRGRSTLPRPPSATLYFSAAMTAPSFSKRTSVPRAALKKRGARRPCVLTLKPRGISITGLPHVASPQWAGTLSPFLDPRQHPSSCRSPSVSPLPGEGAVRSLITTLLPFRWGTVHSPCSKTSEFTAGILS